VTSFVHIGTPAAPGDVESLHRAESERVAERLKVLADGTRVAVLRQLSREPASVMDLSRRFRLAQPTVSNHVKLLRDAGLLDARKDGARVVYSASRERVSRLLAEAEHLLLDHC
jgi:ArsR family transcriptional regulator